MLAKIYQPAKSAMQSGKAKTHQWLLEFEPSAALSPDALMGWASSADPNRQVRMSFETCEQAVAFARANNIPHRVVATTTPKRIIKSYGANFAFDRREPWSH